MTAMQASAGSLRDGVQKVTKVDEKITEQRNNSKNRYSHRGSHRHAQRHSIRDERCRGEIHLLFSVLRRLFPKEAQIRLWCLQGRGFAYCCSRMKVGEEPVTVFQASWHQTDR